MKKTLIVGLLLASVLTIGAGTISTRDKGMWGFTGVSVCDKGMWG